jgi:hypothetical protein
MPEESGPDWLKLYQAALLEVDRKKLPDLIEQAHDAINKRRQLLATQNGRDATERQALEDALQNLRVLRREAAGNAPSDRVTEPFRLQ